MTKPPSEPDILLRAQQFRELHDAPDIFVVANAWNIGTARILYHLGFRALATTSAGLAFSLGTVDGAGAVSEEVSLNHAQDIVEATPLPVTADLENGFGKQPDAVARVIHRAVDIGLAGASIEDASYESDDPIYDKALAVERVAAAVEAARSHPRPFVLTARADGFIRSSPNLDDVIDRLVAFEQAGADVLYAPGLPTVTALQHVCSAVSRPVNYVVGVSPYRLTLKELADVGVKRVSIGTSFARAALGQLIAAAREVVDGGTFDYSADLMSVSEFNEFFK